MTAQSVITEYLTEIGNRPRIPIPQEYIPKPPPEILDAYQQLRIAYDNYIATWASLSLGDRKQKPKYESAPKIINDLPMVKDVLLSHIEKNKRPAKREGEINGD